MLGIQKIVPAISRIDRSIRPTPSVADGVAAVDDTSLGRDGKGPESVQVIGVARVVRFLGKRADSRPGVFHHWN